MEIAGWREPMPQTVEAYKSLAMRDLELIMWQKAEIISMKRKLNDLQQKINRGRYVPVRKLKRKAA